jgi:zinc protease
VLREPTLPGEEFDVLKRGRLASLEQQRTEPAALASQLLSRQLAPYGPQDVRYVPTLDEEIERVQAVTVEDVRRLYREFLGSGAGELAIVGDFDPAACMPVLHAALVGWTAARPYGRMARPATDTGAGSQHRMHTPDKANATYTAGIVIPLTDGDPDYPALVMANVVLGGSTLTSRLGDRIRQREGFSYGVSSSFSASALDSRASLTVTAICNPLNITKVAQAIHEEVERLAREGVTAEELARARAGYLEQQRVRRTKDAALAGILSNLLYARRTMAYYTDLENKIAALTPAQVSEAFRRHIDPGRLVIVSAGDFAPDTVSGQ